ncbi:MAG: hypothetical protein LBD13_03355 [Spirochaetaceae bacterium]|jgi:hypothetical protein|nr:hypothetical protein [Spirochaetaceae bacterium]
MMDPIDLNDDEGQEKRPAKPKGARDDGSAGISAALAGGEVSQRYGGAVKEHLAAYGGVDNEANKTLKINLKSVSEYKVNPDSKAKNFKTQAGFSAEVKETARENAERIINGDKTRVVRTDDVKENSQIGGHTITKNDQLYDHVTLDEHGTIIEGSGSQMKFVGKNPQEALDNLASKKCEKYLDANAELEVPSDYYDEMKADAQARAAALREQAARLRAEGKTDLADKQQAKAEKYEKIHKNLEKSKVSNKDALEARLHPELSTIKDAASLGHRAGIESAKAGALIGGGVSVVKNVVAMASGEKSPEEAALAVAKDTGTAAATSYVTGFGGSLIAGAMRNAENATIRTLSKTSLPAMIVSAAVEAGKTLGKYLNGEIDGTECLVELGEKGTGMISSACFAALGQMVIPIPVVGALVGGMAGYVLNSALYKHVAGALQGAKLAREERIRIEAECEEAIKRIRESRAAMEAVISEYLAGHKAVFQAAFDDMKAALQLGDIDGFIAGANAITCKLGGKPQFNTFSEFDALMQSSEPLRL